MKHELGNTLLKKVTPGYSNEASLIKDPYSIHIQRERESGYLSEKSSNILNGLHEQSEREKKTRKDKESVLKGLDDEKTSKFNFDNYF